MAMAKMMELRGSDQLGKDEFMAQQHREYRSAFGDTTYTKVFVGGLAWETPTERMREYFQQFGDILEAVIITDRTTGKSKGYGFVTFGDPESARLACADPNPMIDGRRANCNIASFGRPRPSPPRSRIEGGGGAGQEMMPSSSSLQYGGVPTATQAVNPFFYQSYGCTPGYGYHQQYNPQQIQQYQQQQQQQVEYYNQLYANMMSNVPYGYGAYGYQAASGSASTGRPSFYNPQPTAARMNNNNYMSVYYPPTSLQHTHQGSHDVVINPIPPHAPTSHSSPDSQVEQPTAGETEGR